MRNILWAVLGMAGLLCTVSCSEAIEPPVSQNTETQEQIQTRAEESFVLTVISDSDYGSLTVSKVVLRNANQSGLKTITSFIDNEFGGGTESYTVMNVEGVDPKAVKYLEMHFASVPAGNYRFYADSGSTVVTEMTLHTPTDIAVLFPTELSGVSGNYTSLFYGMRHMDTPLELIGWENIQTFQSNENYTLRNHGLTTSFLNIPGVGGKMVWSASSYDSAVSFIPRFSAAEVRLVSYNFSVYAPTGNEWEPIMWTYFEGYWGEVILYRSNGKLALRYDIYIGEPEGPTSYKLYETDKDYIEKISVSMLRNPGDTERLIISVDGQQVFSDNSWFYHMEEFITNVLYPRAYFYDVSVTR